MEKISERLVVMVQRTTEEIKAAALEAENAVDIIPGILVGIYGVLGAIAIELAKMNERAETVFIREREKE